METSADVGFLSVNTYTNLYTYPTLMNRWSTRRSLIRRWKERNLNMTWRKVRFTRLSRKPVCWPVRWVLAYLIITSHRFYHKPKTSFIFSTLVILLYSLSDWFIYGSKAISDFGILVLLLEQRQTKCILVILYISVKFTISNKYRPLYITIVSN